MCLIDAIHSGTRRGSRRWFASHGDRGFYAANVTSPRPETVTVLFTDVVGSTAFRTRVGDARADGRLFELERVSRDIVVRHGGEVVKGLGDGVMATFWSAVAALD